MIEHARTSSVTPVLPLTAERDAVPLALLVLRQFELVPVERLCIWRARILPVQGTEAMQRLVEGERRRIDVGKTRFCRERRLSLRGFDDGGLEAVGKGG